MYDEERGRGFDDLSVTVVRGAGAGGGAGLKGKVWRGLRSIFP